jgi:class 3 adenylate cyclase/HEAT repeat protein
LEKLKLSSMAAQAAMEALQTSSNLGREAKITSHVLLKAFDREKKGIEILHRDLFDASTEVVLSALSALGELRDKRSLKHIARLLTQPEEAICCAAVRAIGDIGHPGAARMLQDLFKVSKAEELRCAILETLAMLCPQDAGARRLIHECFSSTWLTQKTRATAARLTLLLGIKEVDISELLTGAKEPIWELILGWAASDRRIRAQLLKHGAAQFGRLSAAGRGRLVDLASPFCADGEQQILCQALADLDPAVRQSAYRKLGDGADQDPAFSFIVTQLSGDVDADLSVEEEALSAIQRMEEILSGSTGLSASIGRQITTRIQEEFASLSASAHREVSDSHELGWLISRSKEYVEYYADEDFRQALLHFLKGSGYYTRERILGDLKSTAVKVEVRHFEGYRALVDIIQNPKRPGIGLIARELAIAKLGKRKSLYRLIRNLRLSRLLNGEGVEEAADLFLHIFDWAKQARLYRLAEAALYALAKADPRNAADACLECLKPPVFSKICAIGAIRLLHQLDTDKTGSAAINLLSSTDDVHVLLNLIDAVEKSPQLNNDQINKCMVALLRDGSQEEVARRAAAFLSGQSTLPMLESILDMYDRLEPSRRELILMILERRIQENRIADREAAVELLYRVLRDEADPHKPKAVLLLWKLGDDYAPQLLKEFLAGGSSSEIGLILQGLQGSLQDFLVRNFMPLPCLLHSEHAGVHEVLRQTLLSAGDEATRDFILKLVLAARGEGGSEREEPREPVEELRVDFFKEKQAYRFEREYLQELAILFTDIQGYSRKAQNMSTLQLTNLIQEYEGILIPTLSGHGGELIKKMGDGHLYIFSTPMNAVLAAIRVQKALKRFNSYREESQRIVIRIGIHWGKVVRKQGDVLGNHVNIASRLESSAHGGSILMSEAIYRPVAEHVHVRDLGLMEMKGIPEPIRVYEPYEISLDLPAELDPMRKAGQARQRRAAAETGAGSGVPLDGGRAGKTITMDLSALDYISASFSSLNHLCRQAEAEQIAVAEIRKELVRRWLKVKPFLAKGRIQ